MLNTQQTKIYEGLRQIGEAIANFYLDAIALIDPSCTLPSKANLIAHLAREIDSGIRDAFSPITKKKEKEKELREKGLKEMGHFASILVLLGKEDIKNNIATEWFEIAKEFPALAHRHKISKPSRDSDEIVRLWNKYEKILFIVIGSNLSITNRLDGFINHTPPTDDTLEILKNIISVSKNAAYFFVNLSNPAWLNCLREEGFFKVESAPKAEDEKVLEEWFPLRYLVNIASMEDTELENKIIVILEHIITSYNEDSFALHDFSIGNLIEVLIRLKHYPFTSIAKKFFIKIHSQTTQSWSLYNHNILDKLPRKFLNNSNAKSINNLLDYAFGYFTSENPEILIEDLRLPAQIKVQPYVDAFALSEFIEKYGKEVVELVGKEALTQCIDKIKGISQIDSLSFSNLEIPSIEITNQSHYTDHWQAQLVNFIRDCSSYLNISELEALVSELIECHSQILQRLGIHLIRINFQKLGIYWWKYISKYNIGTVSTHEPFVLIKELSLHFSDEEIKKTIDWIESIKEHEFDIESYSAKEHRYYSIRKWLLSFNEKVITSNRYLNEKVKFYDELNNWEINNPEFDSYYTSYVGHQLPIPLDEFGKLSIQDQISYFNNFTPDDNRFYTKEGLSQLLKECVVDNSDKYLIDLDPFISLPSVYMNGLLEGLTFLIQNNKILDYRPVLNFVAQKIEDKSFTNETEKPSTSKHWLISSFARLFTALAETKPLFDFDKNDLLRLQTIVLSLLKSEDVLDNNEKINHDYITHIWNSVRGKLLESLLKITLVWAENFAEKDSQKKWNHLVESYFTSRLIRTDGTHKELSFVIGVYLPWFMYLDKEWVYTNAEKIYNESYADHFNFTLQSSFTPYFRLNSDLYYFFKEKGIFSKAVENLTFKSPELDRLIQYALWEWDYLGIAIETDTGLLSKMFQKPNKEQLTSFIHNAKKSKWLTAGKTKFLVRQILRIVKNQPDLYPLYSDLLWFLEDIKIIDEDFFQLVDEVTDNEIANSGTVYFFIRHIFKVADTNLLLAGKIIEKIIRKDNVHVPGQEDLVGFVTKLYESGNKELADDICVLVSDRGSLILKVMYNRYN